MTFQLLLFGILLFSVGVALGRQRNPWRAGLDLCSLHCFDVFWCREETEFFVWRIRVDLVHSQLARSGGSSRLESGLRGSGVLQKGTACRTLTLASAHCHISGEDCTALARSSKQVTTTLGKAIRRVVLVLAAHEV